MRPISLLLVFVAAFAMAAAAQAQDPASVNWALTEDTLVTNIVGEVTGEGVIGEGIEARDYTGSLSDDSEGPLGPFQRWWLNDLWPDETTPNANRYIEFAMTVNADYIFNADSVSLYLNAGGTGNMMASLFYDTDPAFGSPTSLAFDVEISRDELGYYSYGLSDVELVEGDTLYFRIYPWLDGGSTSEGKYVFLQDVTISGEAVLPPIDVEGVYWALSESDTTSVSATGENLGGAAERFSGLEVRNYADDSDPGPGPLGAIQRVWIGDGMEWPDETAPNPDRYIEFAAAAGEGYEFDVDGISLYLNAHGTSNMMATLVYSTDPTFAMADTLEANMEVPRKQLTFHEYEVDAVAPEGDSLYFRVYPWLDGGGSPTKYVLIQAVTIHGEAQLPPIEVEGVYWALSESDTTSVSATGENLGGAAVRASGLEIRNYADDSDPGPGPLGAIQRWWIGDGMDWPDETAPNPDRYVEFAAAANVGWAFAVDSVSLYLNTHGTSNMMATLVYSTDPTFAMADTLEANMEVPRKQLTFHEYDIDAFVAEGDSLYFRVYPWLDGGGSPTKYVLIQAVTINGEAVDPVVSNEDGAGMPFRFALHASYPNPVQAATTVEYELAEAGEVEVVVYNLLGQRVMKQAQGQREAGAHRATLDVSGLASGVYLLRLQAGDAQRTQKITVAR